MVVLATHSLHRLQATALHKRVNFMVRRLISITLWLLIKEAHGEVNRRATRREDSQHLPLTKDSHFIM